MGRVKIFFSLALIGFVLGIAGYAISDYIKTVNLHFYNKLLDSFVEASWEVVTSPWFISGLMGSVLLVSIAIAIAYISPRYRSS